MIKPHVVKTGNRYKRSREGGEVLLEIQLGSRFFGKIFFDNGHEGSFNWNDHSIISYVEGGQWILIAVPTVKLTLRRN